MPQLKLTKTNIDRVAKPGGKSDVLYWDKDAKGFGLRVTPTGLSKFIAQGRVRGTNTDVRVTIGSYGAWTVDEARRKADEYRHQFEQGVDPREVTREQKAMQVTLQTVLDAYVGRPGKLRATTAAEYRRHVEQVFASWCDKPIASISRDMVKDRHAEMMTGGLDGKRAAPASANAAMVTLRILFNFAMDEYRRADGSPLITHNPVGALKHHWAKLGSRTERYVERGRVGAVWNTLQEAPGPAQPGRARRDRPHHLPAPHGRAPRRGRCADLGSGASVRRGRRVLLAPGPAQAWRTDYAAAVVPGHGPAPGPEGAR